MTILDPCMSLERIKKKLGVLGVVDMRQLLLNARKIINASMRKRKLVYSVKNLPIASIPQTLSILSSVTVSKFGPPTMA